jgi:lipopolysaccharide export system protein LptA
MIRKIIVAFGLLIFIYSLFEVLRSFRVIQERFVSIFEGEIVSKVSLKAKEAAFKDDIAYASEVDLSFGAENIGDVKVFADKSTYNIKKGIIELFGNVKFKSEKIYAELDRAKVFLDQNSQKIRKIDGSGNVFINYENTKEVRAKNIQIYPEKNEIILSGNPILKTGNITIRAEKVKIIISSGDVEFEGVKAQIKENKIKENKEK